MSYVTFLFLSIRTNRLIKNGLVLRAVTRLSYLVPSHLSKMYKMMHTNTAWSILLLSIGTITHDVSTDGRIDRRKNRRQKPSNTNSKQFFVWWLNKLNTSLYTDEYRVLVTINSTTKCISLWYGAKTFHLENCIKIAFNSKPLSTISKLTLL